MDVFVQLLPLVMPIVAPLITAGIEWVFTKLGLTPPKPVLPIVNAASGILVAGLAGAPARDAVIAGPVMAMLGNRVREKLPDALTINPPTPTPPTPDASPVTYQSKKRRR